MTRGKVDVEVVGEPRTLRGRWEQLARGGSPFAHAGFFEAWAEAFGDERSPFVIAVKRAGAVEMIVPMWHARGAEREWSSLGAFRADYTEAAHAADDRALGRAFWDWLGRSAPCSSAKISRLRGDSMLARTAPRMLSTVQRARAAASALLAGGGLRFLESREAAEHPYADAVKIAELAARIDSRDTKRKLNVLGRHGAVRYRTVRGRELEQLLPRFFELHRTGFAATGRSSQFEDKREQAFYLALAAREDLAELLYMDVLEAGSRLAALHLGFADATTIYWYKPAFDIELEKASPGRILLAHLFSRARAGGVQRVDLLKGLEPYKSDWSNQIQRTLTIEARQVSVRAIARRLGAAT